MFFGNTDWNGDGKIDVQDSVLDYVIAHQVLGIPIDEQETEHQDE